MRITLWTIALVAGLVPGPGASASFPALAPGAATLAAQEPVVRFRSSVDLVRLSAVVRDRKGRFVKDLRATDFEVVDGGSARPITDFQQDPSGVSVALLFDVSGSMDVAQKATYAREAGTHVLAALEAGRDESAVFAFDTSLAELAPFASGAHRLPAELERIRPFGATSLHDAIAATARRVEPREGRRRAVVVFTDGSDNWSHLTAGEVSGIASSIDVPVYVIGIAQAIDNPENPMSLPSAEHSALAGALSDLANWTGGRVIVASTPNERRDAARQIIDELRHQYLLAFESSGTPGWHPLVVRARARDLTVHARSGYFAGQSRPFAD